jgi:hypothetical protein
MLVKAAAVLLAAAARISDRERAVYSQTPAANVTVSTITVAVGDFQRSKPIRSSPP